MFSNNIDVDVLLELCMPQQRKKTLTKRYFVSLNKCHDRSMKIVSSIKLLIIGLHLSITKIPTLISLRFTAFN